MTKYALFYDPKNIYGSYVIKEFAILDGEVKNKTIFCSTVYELALIKLSEISDGPVLLASAWQGMDCNFIV